MTAPDWNSLLAGLSRWSALGERMLTDGTRLVGHVPHVAPEAWLHSVFAPLSDPELLVLEEHVGRGVPLLLAEFYRTANGLSLFSDSLAIFGLRRVNARVGDAARQPFSIRTPNQLERPRGAPSEWVYVGSYSEDGSQVAVDSAIGRVIHCDRDSVVPKLEWPSFYEFLSTELNRLGELYDDAGHLTLPNADRIPEMLRAAPPPA